MKNDTPNRPTHHILHVVGDGEKKRWFRIGAAWAHKDGKGFNLDLEYWPTEPNASIVLRTPMEHSDKQEAAK